MGRFLILASQSPRRIAFFKSLGIPFRAQPVLIDESVKEGETPPKYLDRITRAKLSAARRICGEAHPIVVADTIVVLGKEIIGKPTSRADAIRMLRALSGQRHVVWTMVRMYDPRRRQAESKLRVKTGVHFIRIPDAMLQSYIKSGEWKDKAGAYAVQGLGSLFIEKIQGSLSNVIGFPLFEFLVEAKRLRIL